ncbi:tetratricopeptide repeat protein, partial [Azospirillum sp. B506]|uniref:tetratricopeptide repeat protein n=1 Tax=Azospirillum sp. B506 TaxID=137721 RepID=UPI00190233BD
SGAALQILTLHRQHVTGLAPRPDGTLVSSGAEETLVVFSSDTGKPVMTFGEDQRVARRELLRHFVLEQTALQFESRLPRLAVRPRPQKWIDFCLLALVRMPRGMLRLLRRKSLNLLTEIALGKGNYELTINLAAEWIRRDPTSPIAWAYLGNAFQALQEYPASLAAFDMATTLVDEINCLVNRKKIKALEIVARGDTRLYRDVLRSAYAADRSLPGNVAMLHTLAEAHAALGEYDSVNNILVADAYKQAKLLYHGNIYYDQLLLWIVKFREDPDRFVPPLGGGTRPSYLIAFVVWGESFHEVMEQITLPCLLASGNLPYLSLAGSVRILFFTPESEVRRLEEMPILAELRRYSQCKIIGFPSFLTSFPDKYKLMSALHVAALTISQRDKSHFIFLAPDIVFSENYLETLDRYRASGKGIVMVGGIMLELTGFRRALNWKPDNVASPLSLNPSTLLELGLQHLHHVSVKNFYATEMDRSSASIIFWPLRNGGLIAHGFHHTPYLISSDVLARYDGSFFLTIDSDFMNHIVKNESDLNDCVIISDAREANYFELSRPERSDTHYICNNEVIVRWGSVQGIAARWLFEKRVDFAPQGVQADDPAVIASDKIVKEILTEIDIRKNLISHECDATSSMDFVKNEENPEDMDFLPQIEEV